MLPKTDIFVARLDPTTKRLKHLNTVLALTVWDLNDVVKIGRKRASYLMSDEAVYRTAPATPGLLIIEKTYPLLKVIL